MTSRRYRIPTGIEAEFQPGSRNRVLRNIPGIHRKLEMDQLEADLLVTAQENWYHKITSTTRMTAETICAMHYDWMGEIYAWAGKYRTVELAKGDFQWPPAYLVSEHMRDFEQGILATFTPCLSGSIHQVAEQLALVHTEFILIHPFREGNGRLGRWLADLMAVQAGFPPLEYGLRGRGQKKRNADYVQAVKNGFCKEYYELTGFFTGAIECALAMRA